MSTLYVVATPIGNIADITERAVQILGSVSFVLCEDTRTSGILLSRLGIKAELISYHKFNEKGRAESVAERMAAEDLDVAVISDAGTPCISDPGVEIVRECANRGISVVGVPGASATVTAMSIAGFDGTFAFVGFLPRKKSELKQVFTNGLPTGIDNHVFYESPKRVVETLEVLAEVLPQAEICVCNDLTKKFERIYRGTALEALEGLKSNPNAELGEYAVVLHHRFEQKAETAMPAEAAIFMQLLEGASMRDAKENLAEKFGRNELYAAALRVKEFLQEQ
jgi:16S rRNA (cytidine1402-2'-O)-methyltransferase